MSHAKFAISAFLLGIIIFIPTGIYCDQRVIKEFGKDQKSGKIVFSSYMSGNWQIWAIDPRKRDVLQLTHIPHEAHYPALSPDGRRLVYATNEGEIWLMEIGGNPQKLSNLPKNCTHPSWSPDGSKIAFIRYSFQYGKEDGDICIVELKHAKVWKLLDQKGVQKYPAWSPDGSNILYTTGYRVSPSKIIEELWLIKSNGIKPRILVSNKFSNIQPDWSPNGQKIAFASDQSGNMEIWIVDKDGKNARNLTQNKAYDADPSWSPDGSKICFVSTRGGKMDIWIMDSDGGNVKQLTGFSDSIAESKEPDWSP